MQTLNTDIDSIGGGLGGVGGGNNQLLWLLLLLKDGSLGGSNGADSAKLDCLSQGQSQLRDQIADNAISRQFESLGAAMAELAGISRDSTAAVTGQINDLSRQNAECCCELKAGQQAIQTSIAMQTNELNVVANANTQRIMDKLCDQANAVLQQDNDRLRQQLSEQTITSALAKSKAA
ncbi:coil containing protein [Vibrio phage 1.259.O._10N.286.48.F4]|nr:coil containing protein [Vibrio phage 1.259.O._10N.286.48.F4]